MKKNRFLYVPMIILLLNFISSCQKDPEPGGTAVQNMAGDWYVQWEGLPGTYFSFSTYNTSANSATEMWFTDNGSFWSNAGPVKGKVNVNMSNQTFSVQNTPNITPALPITFSIRNGKIIPNGTKGPVSKNPTDSIYFEAEFSDDPGTTYILKGYKRTGFAQDDH